MYTIKFFTFFEPIGLVMKYLGQMTALMIEFVMLLALSTWSVTKNEV